MLLQLNKDSYFFLKRQGRAGRFGRTVENRHRTVVFTGRITHSIERVRFLWERRPRLPCRAEWRKVRGGSSWHTLGTPRQARGDRTIHDYSVFHVERRGVAPQSKHPDIDGRTPIGI